MSPSAIDLGWASSHIHYLGMEISMENEISLQVKDSRIPMIQEGSIQV